MSFEEASKLGIGALKKSLGKEFNIERVDGAYIGMGDKTFKRFTREEISRFNK